jgi:Domain of unknown function(DUF2779).
MRSRLSKTGYLRYLQCPQEFWLETNQPLYVRQPYSLEYEHLRQQGYAVQQLAKELERFQGANIDFERPIQTNDLYARCDIIVTNNAAGSIDIYEVKASSQVKEEHYDDVAFQKLVAERAGLVVNRCFVITMNGEYVRRGKIDIEQLFVVSDVTEKINERMDVTARQIKDAMAYLKTVPIPSLVDYCVKNKLDCEYIKLHFPDLPEYTVFDISFLKNEKRRELLSQGVVSITDVPDDFPLSSKQRIQVQAAKTGEVIIDRLAISKRMAEWEYPLQFLDYETFAYAIPQFEGVRPFQQMCFQYSLHTIDTPGGNLRHSYFLSRGDDDPPRAMAAHLKEAMEGTIGTVFVWYEAFEKTRNSEMAVMFPEFADFFNEVNDHTVDLMKVFSDKLYIHPGFKGRSSIKKVLPALVPELSYADLEIGDGLTATISWFRAVKWDSIGADARDQTFENLEKYCETDTIAMVEIFKVLLALEER